MSAHTIRNALSLHYGMCMHMYGRIYHLKSNCSGSNSIVTL